MLYNEFITGTGCKDNEHNYKVYKNLEIMYMNSDMSKEEIYEYGKKLVDNSKSQEQLELEAKINAEIESLQKQLKQFNEDYKVYMAYHKEDAQMNNGRETYWKGKADWAKELKRQTRNRIAELKWILG